MHIVHFFDEEKDRRRPVQRAWTDTGGHESPPSAPPAIPPIIITPFNRQIPNPAIDPRNTPPGPPIVPPRRPRLRV